MKVLYISDLDGTLLDNDAEISPYTRRSLTSFIESGGSFTVATARTSATVNGILSGIPINVPVVLMNGVCIYDTAKNEYIKVEYIAHDTVCRAFEILKRHGLFGFWYAVDDNVQTTYYEQADLPQVERFIEQRVQRYGKLFVKLDSIALCREKPLVYYSVFNKKERLEPAAEQLAHIDGLRTEFYRDTYADGFWYLEICAESASKRSAVEFLRKKYGFEHVVGFGDNLNDLPMFSVCDERCAVENARDEVKSMATHIIGSNDRDGVAKWLETHGVVR